MLFVCLKIGCDNLQTRAKSEKLAGFTVIDFFVQSNCVLDVFLSTSRGTFRLYKTNGFKHRVLSQSEWISRDLAAVSANQISHLRQLLTATPQVRKRMEKKIVDDFFLLVL